MDRRDLHRELARLADRYGVEEVERALRGQRETVPATIFTPELGPLESIVKYLRENRGLRLHEIAALVGRDQRAIGVTYRRAKEKMPGPITPKPTHYMIPILRLQDPSLSVLEHLVRYLGGCGLRLHEIAAVLRRDDRTIWTIAHRVAGKAQHLNKGEIKK